MEQFDHRTKDSLLRVTGLCVLFPGPGGDGPPAVDSLSFTVHRGEVVGLLGESGCGKTTTALSILGLLPSSAQLAGGSIHFGGQELLGCSERAMRKIRGAQISLIPQEPGIALNPVMRVGEQIAEVLRAHRPWNRTRRRAAAEEMLATVGFRETRRIYEAFPHQLSGGQLQRVVIAQALVCGPRLVIADEPTASLDRTSRVDIISLLDRLRRDLGVAFLLISHQPAVLAALADCVLVMRAGKVVEAGNTLQVLRHPRHPYPQALLASVRSHTEHAARV